MEISLNYPVTLLKNHHLLPFVYIPFCARVDRCIPLRDHIFTTPSSPPVASAVPTSNTGATVPSETANLGVPMLVQEVQESPVYFTIDTLHMTIVRALQR